MTIGAILPYPSWAIVRFASIGATLSLVGAASIFKIVRRRKRRNIYDPLVLMAETYGETEASSPTPLVATGKNSIAHFIVSSAVHNLLVATILCCISISGYAIALHNYTILANWMDGERCEYLNDYVDAVIYYKKALHVDPNLKRTHLLMARALLRSGRANAAIQELQAATDGTKDYDAEMVLGNAYLSGGFISKARDAFALATKISPQGLECFLLLGDCQAKLGYPDDAYRSYERAVTLNPQSEEAHIRLGALLSESGHSVEALAHCIKAVALKPNEAAAHNILGTVYAQRLQYVAAIAEFRRADEISPRNALSYYNLAIVMERTGKLTEALSSFRACVRLSPENQADQVAIENARREIRRLQSP